MNAGRWLILDCSPGKTEKGIESHPDPKSAFRAMLILSAQEIQYGRVACFRIEPPVFTTIDEVELPDWVREVFDNFVKEFS